jgi:hypothetical protein
LRYLAILDFGAELTARSSHFRHNSQFIHTAQFAQTSVGKARFETNFETSAQSCANVTNHQNGQSFY